jgi:hypothetical protein
MHEPSPRPGERRPSPRRLTIQQEELFPPHLAACTDAEAHASLLSPHSPRTDQSAADREAAQSGWQPKVIVSLGPKEGEFAVTLVARSQLSPLLSRQLPLVPQLPQLPLIPRDDGREHVHRCRTPSSHAVTKLLHRPQCLLRLRVARCPALGSIGSTRSRLGHSMGHRRLAHDCARLGTTPPRTRPCPATRASSSRPCPPDLPQLRHAPSVRRCEQRAELGFGDATRVLPWVRVAIGEAAHVQAAACGRT